MVAWSDDAPFLSRYEDKYSGLRLNLKVEIGMKTRTTPQSSAAPPIGKSWNSAGMNLHHLN